MVAFVPVVRYFNWALAVTILGAPFVFLNGEGLNMSFRVRRSVSADPDEAEVGVEGVEPIAARALNRVFSELGVGPLLVQGGYDAVLGGLFAGDLRSLTAPVQRGPALWVLAAGDDAGDRIADALVPINTTLGLTAGQMVTIAAAALGVAPGPTVAAVLATARPDAVLPFSAAGVRKASDLLDAACRRIGCRWWVRDLQLHLGRRGLVDPTRPAIILTEQNITAPLAEDGSGVVRVPAFFDPNMVPGSQVIYLGTAFKIESVTHSGETRGTRIWTSEIEARAL